MWTSDVDLYCERLGPGLLAEPVNAITNIAFFVAAWMLARDIRRQEARPPELILLAALIVAIGIGSSLFHTLAVTWARWLDVTPILLFQIIFVWLYLRRVAGWQAPSAAAFATIFLATALYGRQFPELFYGSLAYAPAIVALLALGTYHWLAGKPAPVILIIAAGVFSAALFFRTIDAAVCPGFPLGTHFLWHLLTPVVLYLCARSLFAGTGAIGEREAA